MLRIAYSHTDFKKWSKILERYFAQFLVGCFWGCFEFYFGRRRGEIDTPATSVRWSSIVPRKKIALKLGRLFLQILGSVFFGDVWNILCGHPKKHYSTI
jgi:hypothetical protein